MYPQFKGYRTGVQRSRVRFRISCDVAPISNKKFSLAMLYIIINVNLLCYASYILSISWLDMKRNSYFIP